MANEFESYIDMKVIGGDQFIEMIHVGVLNLKAHYEEVNDLNVFPVPDGDTGTNMRRTIETGYDIIKGQKGQSLSISEVAQNLSKGMLLGARGNSGVILSQIFRGLSYGLGTKKSVSAAGLRDAFNGAVKQAYSAVVKPVEGTILTVLREAVKYANKKIVSGQTIYQYISNLVKQAKITLVQTKEMLDVLKEADVIDSGGAGLYYIFEGFKMYLDGTVIDVKGGSLSVVESEENDVQPKEALDFSLFNENSELEFGYCTEFILQLQTSKVDVNTFSEQEVIDYLNSVNGDSIVCLKDGSIVKTHVHTKDPGAILSYVRRWGEFLTIKVENMQLQHNNVVTKKEGHEPKKEHKKFASVVVAQGSGIVHAFKESGVDVIVDGKQTMNPSADDFLKAFDQLDAENIIVLPNNSNIIMAAEQAAAMYSEQHKDVNVRVIKTKSVGQGYVAASMFVFSDDSTIDEVVEDVYASIADVASIEVTESIRNTKVNGVNVVKGDAIAILNHQLVADRKDKVDCLMEAIRKVENINEKELLLLIYNKEVTDKDLEKLHKKVSKEFPNLEVGEIFGDQDVYPFIVALS